MATSFSQTLSVKRMLGKRHLCGNYGEFISRIDVVAKSISLYSCMSVLLFYARIR